MNENSPTPAQSFLRIPVEQLESACESLKRSVGASVSIVESISRSRDIGQHDRHFCTRSEFGFQLAEVGWYFSGAQLFLSGPPGFHYGVSLDSLVSLSRPDEQTYIFTEHYESQTERLTTIHVTPPPSSRNA